MAMEALGRLTDVSLGVIPIDLNAGAATGKYVSLKRASGVLVVFVHAKGTSGGGDNALTLKQATDSGGDGAVNLAVITKYYKKVNASALDGSETWAKVTQAAAATITEASGEGPGDAAIWAFHVFGNQLSDGFTHIRVDAAAVTGSSKPQLSAILYFPYDLEVQRTPANLAAANA
jgi:hypothetical protein